MRALFQDVVVAVRRLRRDLAFSIGVVLTLAVCLAATTAIFTVVRSVLLRPLPYPEAERLVLSYESYPGVGVERAGTSIPNHADIRRMTDIFEDVALYALENMQVGDGVRTRGVTGLMVTPGFFRVLRVEPAHGRGFLEVESERGRHRVALVAHAFAIANGQPASATVGREIRIDDVPHEVVGVLPPAFSFLDPTIQVVVPIPIGPGDLAPGRRFSQSHEQIARLAPGVTLAQAQSRLDAFARRQYEEAGSLRHLLESAGYSVNVVRFDADLVRQVRPALRLLWGGVLLVLLIAAVNITTLSLVRATGRLRELATRTALGASTPRILRQLVTEALVLTMAGAALGLVLGGASLDGLPRLGLNAFPRAHEIRMDGLVFAVVLGLAGGLATVVGALPAFQIGRAPLASVLRDAGRGGTASPRTRRLRRGFVSAQIALAFVLVLGASLLVTSFQRIIEIDPGFVPEQVLTGRVRLPARYADETALRDYASRALAQLHALPGVEHAGLTSYLPFSWDGASATLWPEGRVPGQQEVPVSPRVVVASPGYLDALRIPITRGRGLRESDTADATPVVIVDEVLAERFWPGADPIGKRVYQPLAPEELVTPRPDTRWLTVVGVAASVKMANLVEAGEDARVGAYYLAWPQHPGREIGFAVRASSSLATLANDVRRALAEVDPELEVFDVATMEARVARSLVTRRASLVLTVAFGGLALLLAAIGLYGVLAYQVSQRAREFGIRLALGSGARAILALVLREGAGLVAAGLAMGLVGAALLRGAISSHLYGVGALSPRVAVVALLLVALTALVASVIPAWRAARVSPLMVLSDD